MILLYFVSKVEPEWGEPGFASSMSIPVANKVYIYSLKPWEAWTSIDRCKQCGKGYFSLTFEVGWIDGDDPQDKDAQNHYCSEMCTSCVKVLVSHDTGIEEKTLVIYRRWGLIDESPRKDQMKSSKKRALKEPGERSGKKPKHENEPKDE